MQQRDYKEISKLIYNRGIVLQVCFTHLHYPTPEKPRFILKDNKTFYENFILKRLPSIDLHDSSQVYHEVPRRINCSPHI